MKIATVTTTREPGLPLISFVEYHLRLGVSHMFIFYEGALDAALEQVMQRSQVTVVGYDDEVHEKWRALESFPKVANFLSREVQARQILNAELAVHRARELGMDWIAHLDTDELVFPGTGTLLEHFEAAQRADANQLVFMNHEAVPETEEVSDYFREVTLFKANPTTVHDAGVGLPFIAYQTGKAAARLDRDPVPWGVHRFRFRTDPSRSLRSRSCRILHYPSCGFSRYIAKYKMLGAFEDKYFGQVSIRDNLSFHITARDLVLGDLTLQARELYQVRVMLRDCDARSRKHLLKTGGLLRIRAPSEALSTR
jgi:hypothetical protein